MHPRCLSFVILGEHGDIGLLLFPNVLMKFSLSSHQIPNGFSTCAPKVPNMFTNMLPLAPHLIPYFFPKFYLGGFYNQPNGGITTCLFGTIQNFSYFILFVMGQLKMPMPKINLNFGGPHN